MVFKMKEKNKKNSFICIFDDCLLIKPTNEISAHRDKPFLIELLKLQIHLKCINSINSI